MKRVGSKIFKNDKEVSVKFFREIRNKIIPDGRKEERFYSNMRYGDEVIVKKSKESVNFIKIS
jgi:uncharacterized protein YllA (UPF0747 family)